ncbi:hypothetical protein [Streptomyces sp. JJ38]|uniref:hypothetical protein n=1 Tax=Streptomyces sp. JJ38 TaxID=2738128 RepID=UPI001C56ED70|nr:hypothetical protein [Streptomyces sp. JJ38]MBW1595713.1 hypothetical protein [Streptomyces sp. JJ38]
MSDMDSPAKQQKSRTPAADGEVRAPGAEDGDDEPQAREQAELDPGDDESPLLRRLRAQVNEENRMRRSVRWAP